MLDSGILWVVIGVVTIGLVLAAILFSSASRSKTLPRWHILAIITAAITGVIAAALAAVTSRDYDGSQSTLPTVAVSTVPPSPTATRTAGPDSPGSIAIILSPRAGSTLDAPSYVEASGVIAGDSLERSKSEVWLAREYDGYMQIFPTHTKGNQWRRVVCIDGNAGTTRKLSVLVVGERYSKQYRELSGQPISTGELLPGATITSTVTVIMGKDNYC